MRQAACRGGQQARLTACPLSFLSLSQEDYDQNLDDVARMNDEGERYDLVQ